MKHARIVGIALVLALLSSGLAFAEYRWESVHEPGDLLVSGSIGIAFPFAVVVYPGAELILTGIRIGDTIPIDFGVAARAQAGFLNTSSIGANYGWITVGAGAFGTAHVSFSELEDHTIPWLENFDFYVSLGLAFNYFAYTGDYSFYYTDTKTARLGFASFEGVNWFFRENMALKVEYAYWGYVGNQTTVGILIRL